MGSIFKDSDKQGCGGRIGSSKLRGRGGASPVIFTAGMVILVAEKHDSVVSRFYKPAKCDYDLCGQLGGRQYIKDIVLRTDEVRLHDML